MNDLRTAAQQALEALEYAQQDRECPSTTRQAIAALRAALAQQAEPVEPVAWLIDYEDGEREVRFVAGTRGIQRTPLYTAPPQRLPLTEEEIAALVRAEIEALPSYPSAVEELPYRLARAAERAVWEKNNG